MAIPVNNFSCGFTLEQTQTAALTRAITSIILFTICLIVLLMEVIHICRHRHEITAHQRLFLYLTVATVCFLGALSLHLNHYFEYFGKDTFCVFVAVIDQYTGTVQLFFILGINISLIHEVFRYSGVYERFKLHRVKQWQIGWRFELVLCLASVILPWSFIWIPFVFEEGSYGNFGPWCWIETIDLDTCEPILHGPLQEAIIWYIPYGIVALVSIFCVVYILGFFCYLRFYKHLLADKTRDTIKSVLFLLIFLGVFFLVWLIETITRITVVAGRGDIFSSWMLYAIMTPLGGFAVPIGFFVYLFAPNITPSRRVTFKANVQEYTVDLKTVGGGIVHNSSWIEVPSHTSVRDPNMFLTPYNLDEDSFRSQRSNPPLN